MKKGWVSRFLIPKSGGATEIKGYRHVKEGCEMLVLLVVNQSMFTNSRWGSVLFDRIIEGLSNERVSIMVFETNRSWDCQSIRPFDCVMDMEDVTIALDWLREKNKGVSMIWTVGLFYGAWLAMQLAVRRAEVKYFAAIEPSVNVHDFVSLVPCPARGVMVHSCIGGKPRDHHFLSFLKALNKHKGSAKHIDICFVDSESSQEEVVNQITPFVWNALIKYIPETVC